MDRVKVTTRNQITLPTNVRKLLHIQPGDELRVEVRGGAVILTPEANADDDFLRGLHREVWAGIDPVEYVREERAAWSDPLDP